MSTDTVFISYSHDSPEHSARVLELSNKLRALGVETEIDQYCTRPPQGWPLWCEERLRPENSRYVLTVCTPTYRSRVENNAPADEGRGVYWEGSVVYQYIYEEKTNSRFIPVLLGDEEANTSIPIPLRGYTNYCVRQLDFADSGFKSLYRELTNQPAFIKPDVGAKQVLGQEQSTVPVISAPLAERPTLTKFENPPSLTERISTILYGFEWEKDFTKIILRMIIALSLFLLIEYLALALDGLTIEPIELFTILIMDHVLEILGLVGLCCVRVDSSSDIIRQIVWSIFIYVVHFFLSVFSLLANNPKFGLNISFSEQFGEAVIGWGGRELVTFVVINYISIISIGVFSKYFRKD